MYICRKRTEDVVYHRKCFVSSLDEENIASSTSAPSKDKSDAPSQKDEKKNP